MMNHYRVLGKMFYYVLVEVFGVVLLVFFLLILMNVYELLKFIPWAVGLSSAATGFCVLEKTDTNIRHKHAYGVGSGISVAFITFLVLSTLFLFLSGAAQLDKWNLLIFLVIGACCGELGAVLAIRHSALTR